MPIFTRRSRASTFQIISARLSKNEPMVTFASDTSLPRHTSTSWCSWLRSVAAVCSGFLRAILGFVAETATVSLRTLAFLLSTADKYLFLLQRLTIPFDSLTLLLIRFSRVWRQSFEMEVSGLYSSSPWFTTFDMMASSSSDESPCRTILIRFWVDQTHVFRNFTDFLRFHRMEFLT